MSGEQNDKVSEGRQLLANERDERLLRLINNTGSLKVFDYVANLIVLREVERGDTEETDILLDYLVEKRERAEEVVALNQQYGTLILDEEELGLEEDVRIALFKPLGE